MALYRIYRWELHHLLNLCGLVDEIIRMVP
jgi:hypothetical protein